MAVRRVSLGKRIRNRLVSLTVLLSFCASSFPLAIRVVLPREKDSSAPFACQSRSCGCPPAKQDRQQCCCSTNAERIVRAQESDVKPSTHGVEAGTQGAVVEVERRRRRRESTSLSRDTIKADSQTRHFDSTANAEDSIGFVIGVAKRQCHSQSLFWNSLPWAVIPVIDHPESRVTPRSWDRPRSLNAPSVAAEPPEPPPRLV